MNTGELSIIGPGRVGTAIGMLAVRAGWRVLGVAGRDSRKPQAAAARIGPGVPACSVVEAAGAKLVLLAVPDDVIGELCGDLASRGVFRRGSAVVHFSGALGSDVLSPAADRCGCDVASLHPLATFPTVESAVQRLPGAWFFVEGSPGGVRAAESLAESLHGRCVRIAPAGKALYHAGAVTACNYLAALVDGALRMEQAAGIDEKTAREALGPLVRSTVENVLDMGPAKALTGPIERGDEQTVARHLDALKACDGNLQSAYRVMGMLTVDLALRKRSIDANVAQRLRRLLDQPGGQT